MTRAGRVPLVIANWKMNLGESDGIAVVTRLLAGVGERERRVRLAIAPAFPALRAIGSTLASSSVLLAAQNVHWDDRGAFTGEVSPMMLREAGVRLVLVGHSERRQLFGETDEQVGMKAAACLRNGLVPVVCVGETAAERDAGQTSHVVARQLTAATASMAAQLPAELVVAYEPVWAIGTGRNATSEQAYEVHAFIRSHLGRAIGAAEAESVAILYGGSVTPENAPALLGSDEIDGALVGGASLDPERFLAIARAAI